SEKDEKTIRVVDKVDYYIVLDDDAQLVAEIIYKTNSVIKYHNYNNHKIKYVTISPSVFSNLLKIAILEMGHKLEIYDKNWKLLKLASPGNLNQIEDMINSNDLNSAPIIASVKLVNSNAEGGKKFGLCFVDTNNKIIGLSEFIDNELFSNLESMLIQLGVNECIIPSSGDQQQKDLDFVKLTQVIDRCNIVISTMKPSEFNNKNIEQDLRRLTGDDLVLSTNSISSLFLAQACCNSLINYLNLINDDQSSGNWSLIDYKLEQFMKLDYSAVRALNLFPQAHINANPMNKNSSLFGLLNHCKTIGGTRLLSQWLKQPLVDKLEINKRLRVVELLVNDSNLRTSLQNNFLNQVPDIVKLVKKLSNPKSASSSLNDVIRCYQLCVKLPDLLELLTQSLNDMMDEEDATDEVNLKEFMKELWVDPIFDYSVKLNKFQELVESTIDLKALDEATSASQLNSNNLVTVNPEFDENLMAINERLVKVKDEIKKCHRWAAEDLQMEMDKKLKLENHHIHGWCFRLTRTDSSVIRGDKNYKELQTVKSGVFFTTSKLKELSEKVASLQEEYEKLSNGLIKEIVSIASTYSSLFIKLSIKLSILDVLVSFAHVSSYAPIPYVKPKISGGIDDSTRKCVLKDSRHPCLESQDDITFIANDVTLISNEKEFSIITGPNMGGKSTYIRQIGVIALMAQIGCFVPCTEAELCIFDSILARVGASDSQLKGVSTFMTEMLEMSSILRAATKNSLIIVDELGRGTSTYDGFGLAWSISEHISTKIKCFTLFATHFHELTNLADIVKTVDNLHVVAHIEDDKGTSEDITLLYKVEPGISDQSFGVHVAEIVNFPQKIISMAKRKATELEEYNNDDPYVREKKSKCSEEEILAGNAILKKILKEWKENVDENALND
ncbi:hypothetical protein PACTADRAFT_28693, partial [Pachysolen tannophilus NRRL Y-2460]